MSSSGHYPASMGDPTGCSLEAGGAGERHSEPHHSEPDRDPARSKRRVDAACIIELVEAHYRFIWRLLGRLGVQQSDLDDATQQVFMVLTQRDDLEIVRGSERAFLFGIAIKVAKTLKRTLARRREGSELPLDLATSPEALPDALAEQQRARRLLDEILDGMPIDLRVAFVLYEIEDLGTPEVAQLLNLPTGTAASRLRRAREWFDRRVNQLQARERNSRGGR